MSALSIKVLTINTWKCDGNYFIRLKILADQLKLLRPDLVFCQECFQTADLRFDTLKYLSTALCRSGIFTRARLKERYLEGEKMLSYSGLGVLSAYPCSLIKELILPSIPEDADRRAQIVAVTLPNAKSLFIANVHLTHFDDRHEIRKSQLDFIAGKLRFSGKGALKIIAGDFNATVNDPELSWFATEATNCYELNRNEDQANTWNDFQIRRRVDHIFALNDDIASGFRFIDSRAVLNIADPETKIYASDHPGIITTMLYNNPV